MDFLIEPELLCVFLVIDKQWLVNDADADAFAGDAAGMQGTDAKAGVLTEAKNVLWVEVNGQGLRPASVRVKIGLGQVGQSRPEIKSGQICPAEIDLPAGAGRRFTGGELTQSSTTDFSGRRLAHDFE